MKKTFIICFLASACAVHSAVNKFPADFKFGAATSAYQIEGAWNVSGKSPSVWDHFIHSKPDRVIDLSNGDVACDSYNKWEKDIEVAEELGLDYYRFSISWPRLMPSGYPNDLNDDGVEYYNNLIDGLLAKGIAPVVTLYHWDLPQTFQDLGGWANPLIIDWFSDYARTVYKLYADRVKVWITLNEPVAFCEFSYNAGIHAPGIVSPGIGAYICNKHTMLAHATAYKIYDKEFKPKYKGKVSLSNHLTWVVPETEDDEDTAKLAREITVGMYAHPIYSKKGGWPPLVEEYMKKKSESEGWHKSRLPAFTPEEKKFIKGTYDFYAFNYYTTRTVRKAKEGEEVGQWPLEGNHDFDIVFGVRPEWELGADWFYIYPEGMRSLLQYLRNEYGDIEFYITENGYTDYNSSLNDVNRIKYIRKHLEQVLLAIHKDKIKIKCYTSWTMLDNFEWGFGYKLKFGLYYVDFNDPNRPRLARDSAKYYKKVIATHEIDFDEDNEVNNKVEL